MKYIAAAFLLLTISSPCSAQQSEKSLAKAWGIDDPSIPTTKCFSVSRGNSDSVTILVDQCSGDAWYLESGKEWRWHHIKKENEK